ncbi:CHAT domain-containing tetratricopeptide repeat protein [Winogradskya humida]|uniref:CHAT domain-containing protein n=1 Tax=Winogradskya humida TaxID=113566 RepID=A0ABQ4A290_9ACTN|nr:CHAT domain-containing protein [Actinoplanes humidus]GIE24457.1 hypothetical protein Ahu01nite_075590 [Actinoplanes humidus]
MSADPARAFASSFLAEARTAAGEVSPRLFDHFGIPQLEEMYRYQLLRPYDWVQDLTQGIISKAAGRLDKLLPRDAATRQANLVAAGTACTELLIGGPHGMYGDAPTGERTFRLGQVLFRCLMQSFDVLEEERPGVLTAVAKVFVAHPAHRERAVLFAAAERLTEDAAHFAPPGNAQRPAVLRLLGGIRRKRYLHGGDLRALATAVDALSEAVRLSRPAERADALADLATVLIDRHAITGLGEDYDQAIGCLAEAVDQRPPTADHLIAYSRALCTSRTTDDADQAVTQAEQACRISRGPAPLGALGAAHLHRYALDGDRKDLDRAVAALTEATREPTGTGHRTRLSHLGEALTAMYAVTGNTRTLEQAVLTHRQATLGLLQRPVDASADWSTALTSLSETLLLRFERLGDEAALDEAITALRSALTPPPPAILRHALVRCRLVVALRRRYSASGGTTAHLHEARLQADLIAAQFPPGHRDRAVVLAELDEGPVAEPILEGLQHRAYAEPERSPARAGRMLALGRALAARFAETGSPQDRTQAINALTAAQNTSDPVTASAAAHDAAVLNAQGGSWRAAADAYATVVDLMPALAGTDLSREDQEHRLGLHTGVAADAAVTLLRAGGSPADALALLERGRGLLTARSLPSLPDATTARTTDPAPVVAIVLSDHGSHALINADGGVAAIALPDAHRTTIDEQAAALTLALDLLADDRHDPEMRYRAGTFLDRLLALIWDTIAEPVLDTLGPAAHRIWWMPTGLLTQLPLHAAGRHHGPRGGTVLDRVVSSYTPTLRSLRTAAATVGTRGRWDRQPLTIAVPGDTLPNAEREASQVAARYPGGRLLSGGQATRTAVMDALAGTTTVHFACHADGSPTNPSAAHLLLHDETRLTVRDINAVNLPQAVLAYLSACGTARGGVTLTDEAITVAGAFHLAGFPHVIGTLWSVRDDIARDMAIRIHGALESGPAEAVHHAVTELRDQCEGGSPALWAGYLHIGP